MCAGRALTEPACAELVGERKARMRHTRPCGEVVAVRDLQEVTSNCVVCRAPNGRAKRQDEVHSTGQVRMKDRAVRVAQAVHVGFGIVCQPSLSKNLCL